MRSYTVLRVLISLAAGLVLVTQAEAASIKVWYPLGYGKVDGGGHRYFAVSADTYKFVYDLGRPSITQLYNLARDPSAQANLLNTSGAPGGYIALTDSAGKQFRSYLSDGNTYVSVTKGNNTFNNMFRTRMNFRQAGRAHYQLDVIGIKLAASDGTLAPVTVKQRFHLWPEKFYVETSFEVKSTCSVQFAESVMSYTPSAFTHYVSTGQPAAALSPGLTTYLDPSDPYCGLYDSAGARGAVGHVCPNRSGTDSVVLHYGSYAGGTATINTIQRSYDRDIRGGSGTWLGGQTHSFYHQQSFSALADESELAMDAWNEANPATVAKITSSYGTSAPVSYDNRCGAYKVEIPPDYQPLVLGYDYSELYQNHYETARVRIQNGTLARKVRLWVVRGASYAGSTPWGELVVTDAAGFPIGAPSEQNSDWGAPTPDAYFACYTSVPFAAGETRDLELKIVAQNWGRKPIIRMQCQDLYTWDGGADEQQWMQSSIGQGENMVYHPQRVWCTVEDARGLDSRPLGVTNAWRDNCGGWEFLKFSSGVRPDSRGVIYNKAGPCLFDFTLTGAMDDGSIDSSVRVIAIPANEVTRTFFRIRYDVRKTINITNIPANLRLFAFGDEHYGGVNYPYAAYTDSSGNIVTRSAGSSFTNVRIGGATPWACTYGANPPLGTGGNRGFVLRSYKARINGSNNNNAAITLNAGSQCRLILTANTSATRLISGDYFEFDLETVAFGGASSDYSRMVTEAASFGAGKPSVVAAHYGTKVADFPARVDIGSDGYAEFSITAGRDIIPVEVGGFSSYTNPTASDLRVEEIINNVWVPVDLSTEGRDWWQTEYDETTGRYSFIFCLHTDGSTRRFRVSHLLNKSEAELCLGKSANLQVFPFPAHAGGSYIAGVGDSPVMAGDWLWHTVRNTASSARRFTPVIRYAALVNTAIRLEVNGTNQTGTIVLPATGGANTFKEFLCGDVVLNQGPNTVQLVFESGGAYLDWIEYRFERPVAQAVDDAVAVSEESRFNISSNITNRSTITFRNTGTSTWTAAGGCGLASENDFGAPAFYPVTADVPPGASHKFAITSPPSPAAVRLFGTRWQMKRQEQVFGVPATRYQRSTDLVANYSNSERISDDIPLRMGVSEILTVNVKMRNSGTSTWIGTDLTESHGLVKADSRFGGTGSGTYVGYGERVSPGGDYTFSVSIRAPNTTGVHTLRLRMRQRTQAALGSYMNRQIEVVADATPPTMPVVTDSGHYSTSTSSLSASWTASDQQSGIASYQYAIGTLPVHTGSGMVRGWTSASSSTSVTATGLSLTEGVRYYFYVRACNGRGMWSLVGASDGVTVVRGASGIPEMRSMAEGTHFILPAMLVGASANGQVFIEEFDRTSGLKLNWTGPAPSLTKSVVVAGVYRGIVDNEPTADALTIEQGPPASARPIGMGNRSIGWPGASNPAHSGPDTRCLLVKTWGVVSYVDPAGEFIIVDDGSGLSEHLGDTGQRGIKIAIPPGAPMPAAGRPAAVTGISRATADGKRWLMPRTAVDIQSL